MPRVVFHDKYINPVYKKLTDNINTYETLLFGGSSSGKSYFIFSQWLIRQLLKGGRNFVILRKVARTNKDTTYQQVRHGISNLPYELQSQFVTNKSDMFIRSPNGYTIYFRGMDNLDKLKGFKCHKGIVTDFVVEEASETTYDDYKMLRKRLRGITNLPKRLIYLTNPVNPRHWIKTEIIDKAGFRIEDKFYQDSQVTILHTTYLDNLQYLSPEEVYDLENEDNPYYRDVYTLGKYGVLGEMCFNNWETADIDKLNLKPSKVFHGLDFGWKAASAYVKCFIINKTIYVKRGFYGKEIKFEDMVFHLPKREILICDSAEPRSVKTLQDLGIRNAIGAKKPAGHYTHAIKFLQGYKLVIDKEFVEMQNELSTLQWKTDKAGETLDEPIPGNDHAVMAMIYGLEDIIQADIGGVRTVKRS